MFERIFKKRNLETAKKIFASFMIPIFVLQMSALNLALASPAMALTAVDLNCSDSSFTVVVNHSAGDRCFKTIQSAIDDSSTEAGDTINVKKAKYVEKVVVDKGVIISGEKNADLTGQFTISHDDVTVEKMDIANPDDSFGIIATDASHLTFKNNNIHDIGINLAKGSAQAIGIVSSSSDVSDVDIAGNDLFKIGNIDMLHNGSAGSSAKGVYLGNSGGSKTISDVTISNNDMTKIYASTADWKGSSVGYGGGAGAYGILVNHKTENLKVKDNKINILEGLWSHAIGLENDTPDAEVSGNTINNLKDHKGGADSMALRLESNPSATNIALDNNKFNGKKLSIDISTVFVDAAWTSLNPDINTFPEILNGSTYIYYGINAFSNIQDAVKGVANGGTVNVADGTYIETGQIVIDKDLSIVGHNKTKTIIKPAQDTAGTIHDPSSGWFSVNSGKTFNLNKVTLDGSGKNILAGIFSKGHGIIENSIFNNIHYAKYAGIGIELFGSDMTISKNSFNNIERIGVFNGNNTDSKITGNVYTGKGEGDWLDYAFEVGRGSKADISGNTVSKNRGIANDGSTSAGILVTSYYGPSSSQATITGNKISKCTDGIAVGYDTNDTSVVVAHKNKLSENVNGVNSTKPLVDATENWWGSASGPKDDISGDGSILDTNIGGKGSVALGAVKYAPWYTNAGMTDETSPNAITKDATNISLYDATLNGAGGDYDAIGHSFWVSLAPFATTSPNIPNGVYSTPDFGAIAANTDFSAPLSQVTTQGIHSNMPAITPNTKYYYVAWARVGDVWYPGEIKTFTTSPIVLPSVPTNGQPNNSYETTNNFYFTWDNSTAGSYPIGQYEFQSSESSSVDADGLLINPWNSIANGNSEQNHLTTPTIHSTGAGDGKYYWQVRTIDINGNKSAWSPIWNMTIDTHAPTTPQFSSPADNTFTNVNAITLKWTGGDDTGSGVKGYIFRYVFYSANGGNPIDWSSGFVAGTQKTRSGSFGHGEGRYVMYVRTIDNAGNESSESNPLTVTYDNTAPAVPTGIYFRDTVNNKDVQCGGFTSARNFDVHWNANAESDFDHYEYISFNADGSVGPIRTFTTPDFIASWWTVPVQGTYGVQVRAIDRNGNASAWSGGVQGIVNSCKYTSDWTVPSKVKITAPTAEQSFNKTPILNKWDASVDNGSGIAKYQVWYAYDDKHSFSDSTCGVTTVDGKDGRCRDVDVPATSRNHIPGLNEQGGVTILVRAIDKAGNKGAWSDPVHYVYDATAPIITMNNPNSDPTQSKTITASANEGALSMFVNAPGVTTCDGFLSFIPYADKIFGAEADNGRTICYRAVDAASNVTYQLSGVIAGIDTTAPVVDITSPASGFVAGTVDIKGTVTDANPDHYYLVIKNSSNNVVAGPNTIYNASSFTDESLFTWNTNSGSFPDGTYTIDLEARDKADNKDAGSVKTISVIVDNTVPESTITFPVGDDDGIVYSNDWDGTITGTASDTTSGVAGVKVSVKNSEGNYWNSNTAAFDSATDVLNDAAITSGMGTDSATWAFGVTLPEGDDSYTIKSHATDNVGNMENTYTLTIVLDKTIPEVSLSIDPADPNGDNNWYTTKPTITLNAGDNIKLDKIEYQIDSKIGTWTTYMSPVTIDEGQHIFYYRSLDMAGNFSQIGVKNVKVDTKNPDTVKSVDARYDEKGNAVKLNWNADDEDIYQVYIYKGDKKHFAINFDSRIAKNDNKNEDITDNDVEVGKKYYYKFVSLDEAGNKSDVKIVSIKIAEDGTGVTVTDEGTESAPQEAVLGADANGNENQGQNQEGQNVGAGEGQSGNGQVEGVATSKNDSVQSNRNWWYIILAVIGAILLGTWYYRKRKRVLPKIG